MTTDELRAKFVEWMKSREGYPFAGQFVNIMWTAYQAAHAYRDAEVEALRKDEERYRWLRLKCTDELCVRKGVALVTGAALNAALDDVMREESK